MKLSLVIPCYNEKGNIPLVLERCAKLASKRDVEVIIVDNGSTDNSYEILLGILPNFPFCKCVRVSKNQGYGFGIVSGLKAASGEILAWTHADMQTDPLDVLNGLELFEKYGVDVFVKGKRYGRPLSDVLFTVGMSIFETLLLAKPMWDINAQPTMFSKSFFESWESPPDDFSLDLYAYYMARVSGKKIKRFPVMFSSRKYGISSWNINFSAKKKFISRTIKYSLLLRRFLRRNL
jgi:glycosyltransferase involved in cell wall biosynthesis